VRELRHDFRHYYHACYDEVEPDEAADLIQMLPSGSAYRAALDPHGALDGKTELMLQIDEALVALGVLIAGGDGYTAVRDAVRFGRPWDAADQAAAKAKAHRAAETLRNTEWKDVERDG
jgi:hypothetical protein